VFWGGGDELGQALLLLLPFLDGLRVREPSANPRRNRIVRLLLGEEAADRGTDVPAVLAESGHGLGFRHPLIWAALYDDMPAPVRAAWHRDAGRALPAAAAPADRVARQMLRAVGELDDAAEPVDEWMLDWLARTADRWSPRRQASRPNSLPGPSPVPRPTRPSMASWPADSPTPSTVSVTWYKPSRS